MRYAERILRHEKYWHYLRENGEADKARNLCLHDLQHAVDTARVAHLYALKEGLDLDEDLLYSAALLHDIAKWKQIRDGTVDHAAAGAVLAEAILREIGMEAEDTARIVDAIRTHRHRDPKGPDLNRALYEGDKSSRFCLLCKNIGHCNRFADGQTPVLKA